MNKKIFSTLFNTGIYLTRLYRVIQIHHNNKMINVRKELNRETKRAYNHGYFLINEERLAEGCVQCIHIWSREGVVKLDYTPLAV